VSTKTELWDQLQAAVKKNHEQRIEINRLQETILNGPVRVTLTIESSTEETLIAWARKYLTDRAYSVVPSHSKWETPKEICARLDIHNETLRRNAEKSNRPHVEIRRGESNRIIEVLSNPDFDAYLLRNKYATP
jgi:hypothetical protein